jgi:hypothetical protein
MARRELAFFFTGQILSAKNKVGHSILAKSNSDAAARLSSLQIHPRTIADGWNVNVQTQPAENPHILA